MCLHKTPSGCSLLLRKVNRKVDSKARNNVSRKVNREASMKVQNGTGRQEDRMAGRQERRKEVR